MAFLTSLTVFLGTLVTLSLAWLAADCFRRMSRIMRGGSPPGRRGAPEADPDAPCAVRRRQGMRRFAAIGFPAFVLMAAATTL